MFRARRTVRTFVPGRCGIACRNEQDAVTLDTFHNGEGFTPFRINQHKEEECRGNSRQRQGPKEQLSGPVGTMPIESHLSRIVIVICGPIIIVPPSDEV